MSKIIIALCLLAIVLFVAAQEAAPAKKGNDLKTKLVQRIKDKVREKLDQRNPKAPAVKLPLKERIANLKEKLATLESKRASRKSNDKPRSRKPRSDKPRSRKPRSDKPKSRKPRSDKPRSRKPRSDKPRSRKPKSEKTMTDAEFKKFLGKLKGIAGKVSGVIGKVSPILNQVAPKLGGKVDKFGSILGMFTEESDAEFKKFFGKLKNIAGKVSGVIGKVSPILNQVAPKLGGKVDKIGGILGMFTSMSDAEFKKFFGKLKNIAGKVSGVIGKVSPILNQVAPKLGGKVDKIGGILGMFTEADAEAETDATRDCGMAFQNGQQLGNKQCVLVQGKPVVVETAIAFERMNAAAKAAGIHLQVNSGFRTQKEQEYLYGCYQSKKCNNGNLAARPGYSNHQNGRAMDISCSNPKVFDWMRNNASKFGFIRTVASENWHWELLPGRGCASSVKYACK